MTTRTLGSRMLGLGVLTGLSVLACYAGTAAAQPDVRVRTPDRAAAAEPKESTVTSTGTAKVERTPDFVEIVFGVSQVEKTAGEAQAAAEKAMAAGIKAVEAFKLKDADFKTGTVELSPRYERQDYSAERAPKIIGYQASITTRLKTGDLKCVSKVIDAALTAGCNRVDGVQFGIKEALSAREEALTIETKAARRKAGVMAGALDLGLVRVISVASSTGIDGGWGGFSRYSNLSNNGPAAPAPAGEREDSVVPGSVEIWADVTVSFAAEPKK